MVIAQSLHKLNAISRARKRTKEIDFNRFFFNDLFTLDDGKNQKITDIFTELNKLHGLCGYCFGKVKLGEEFCTGTCEKKYNFEHKPDIHFEFTEK